ncbi:MAG: hypothetical protein V2A56_03265, partial [bacterium]
THRFSPFFLLLVAALAFGGCGRKVEEQQKTTAWDLDPLHRAPHASYHLTESGADRGRLRLEILHQMMDGREVIVQRQHLSGPVSGMTETVFESATFVPLYVQTYEEKSGLLREIRLDFKKNLVVRTVNESLFGGKEATSETPLQPGTLDESQLLTTLRCWPLIAGDTITWTIYSSARNEAGRAEISADAVADLVLAGEMYSAQKVRVSLFGEDRIVWIEDGKLRRVLLVEGPGQKRLEIDPS